MKKLYLLLLAAFFFLNGMAQPVITIASGTDLVIKPGTSFSLGGLSITPSSGFTLSGLTVSRNATVSHATSNTYVSRVYHFSNNTNPFDGTVRFYYLESELNGLNESALRVNIHDGTSWQAINSVGNDIVNNYVETIALSGQVINELTAAEQLFPLPLSWGLIYAYRESQVVKINWTTLQEENVSHFSVEKSTDAINWTTVIDNFPARNSPGTSQYIATDNEYNQLGTFYRVKQTDKDGRFTYSKIVTVVAEAGRPVAVYPNPVINAFYINNISSGLIKQVRLYNVAGLLVKTWTSLPPSYNIQDLPGGIYQLRILFKDGRNENVKINKL